MTQLQEEKTPEVNKNRFWLQFLLAVLPAVLISVPAAMSSPYKSIYGILVAVSTWYFFAGIITGAVFLGTKRGPGVLVGVLAGIAIALVTFVSSCNMQLNMLLAESPAVFGGHSIPVKYTSAGNGGNNVSIPLSWSNVPPETKSVAILFFEDRFNPNSSLQWAVINIPPTTTNLEEGASGTAKMPPGSIELTNSFGKKGYSGPEPAKKGLHVYRVFIYALNADKVNIPDKASYDEIQGALEGKILTQGVLEGTIEK